jgi:AcrR family transcriptional regulator
LKDNKRKDLIIQSARERFARYGFKKTSMDEIAADLRMGKATLYYYYKSKEEIFEAVVKSEFHEFAKELKSLEKNSEKSLAEKLNDYFQIRQKTFDDGYNLTQLHIDAVGLMHLLEPKSVYFELIKIEEDFLKTILQDHFKKGKINHELDLYVSMISKFARGMILMTKVDNRKSKESILQGNEWKCFVELLENLFAS